jgi:UDP-N-acetylglucosamine--N-acetylmuramyl-(pentapeptide) pyrophosphoryl-undecaprenol N-acetylglucosamine transferase
MSHANRKKASKKKGGYLERLLICAGGTGGGVYPALAVWQALADTAHATDVLWVGGKGGMEADLVKRAGIPYEEISAAGVHGVGLAALPGNLLQLSQGYLEARQILARFQPEVLFFTGGYVAVPMALAGRSRPSLLYVPDIEPGLALKTLARSADRIAVTTDSSRKFFNRKANITVSGYPTRPDLKAWDRPKAYQSLGLSGDLPVVFVFGGSKGARSINRALLAILPDLLNEAQVLHVSGSLDWPEVQAASRSLAPELAERYHPHPYLHEEMGAAYSVADLVVSRAGASTLGEFPLFGLPAILVPYPYAWRYQRVNAEYLADRGAAILLRDDDLTQQLLPRIRELLGDPARRERMRRAMYQLATPQAARFIAEELSSLARSPGAGGPNL